MERRKFIQTTGGIACLGILGTQTAVASSHETLVNAAVTSSGAIVATGDDFVISGQEIAVDGTSTFYNDNDTSYVIYNDGYSGKISGNTLTVSHVNDEVFGIHSRNGDVEVTDNVISAGDDVGGQFIGVALTGEQLVGSVETLSLEPTELACWGGGLRLMFQSRTTR